MARKSSRKPVSRPVVKPKKASGGGNLDVSGILPIRPWVKDALAAADKSGPRAGNRHGRILIVPTSAQPGANAGASGNGGVHTPKAGAQNWLAGHLEGVPSWQRESALKTLPESVFLADDEGPIWVLMPRGNGVSSQDGAFSPSHYGRARDLVGACVNGFREYKLESVTVAGFGCSREHWLGVLTGMDLGAYRFVQVKQNGAAACKLPALNLPEEVSKDHALIDEASAIAMSVNVARHFVNLPANDLNPATYSTMVSGMFKGSRTTSVKVLEDADLAREGMNLLRAVGSASPTPPCLVHIRYRPIGSRRGEPSIAPVAFVGKGITFDTGGLDIKPSSGMRWMKKDMGGSATIVGLALHTELMQADRSYDFYLAIAENSVSSTSMRPGDVFRARNGMTVEIHNTDAEGRLVMADAFDYALTRPGVDEPSMLIDASTLTGAMRVAVGLTISGMFATHDHLAEACISSGQQAGDPCWRMPLFDEYKTTLKSHAADVSNCSDSSFGGAITAALFLEKFTRGKPWIHFDYYAWADRAAGAMAEPGGNGQALQLLIRLISQL